MDKEHVEACFPESLLHCLTRIEDVDLVTRFKLAWDRVAGAHIADGLTAQVPFGCWPEATRNEFPRPSMFDMTQPQPESIDGGWTLSQIGGRHPENIDGLSMLSNLDFFLGL